MAAADMMHIHIKQNLRTSDVQEEVLAERDLTAPMEELSPREVSFQPAGIRLAGAELP